MDWELYETLMHNLGVYYREMDVTEVQHLMDELNVDYSQLDLAGVDMWLSENVFEDTIVDVTGMKEFCDAFSLDYSHITDEMWSVVVRELGYYWLPWDTNYVLGKL